MLLALPGLQAHARTHRSEGWARDHYAAADRMREALNGRPLQERSRRDYQRVINAYRAVYYGAPTSAKADPSAVAVAETLVEMGRRFDDENILNRAIAQYKFLRKEYPGSKYRCDALFTIGEIYKDDLNDSGKARATFVEFLLRYPHNRLVPDAQQAIAQIDRDADQEKKLRRRRSRARIGIKTKIKTRKPEIPSPRPPEEGPPRQRTLTSRIGIATRLRMLRPCRRKTILTLGPTRAPLILPTIRRNICRGSPQSGTGPRPTTLGSPSISRTTSSSARSALRIPTASFSTCAIPNLRRPWSARPSMWTTVSSRRSAWRSSSPDARASCSKLKISPDYDAFLLPNPYRLIIDIHGKTAAKNARLKTLKEDASTADVEAPPEGAVALTTNATAVGDPEDAPKQDLQADAGKAPVTTEDVNEEAKVIPKTIASVGLPDLPRRRSTTRERTPAPTKVIVDNDDDDRLRVEACSERIRQPARAASSSSRAGVEPEECRDDIDVREARPTASGDRSLIRALGLKIGKIVIDPGHGGHDTGTIGPNGLRGKGSRARRRPATGQDCSKRVWAPRSSTPARTTRSFRSRRARRSPTSSAPTCSFRFTPIRAVIRMRAEWRPTT